MIVQGSYSSPRSYKADLPNQLQGIGSVPTPADAKVIFSHPLIGKLTIWSGINQIQWAYNLNTFVQQTYGGEVVQILSCNVGPMQIVGSTRGMLDPAIDSNQSPNTNFTPWNEMDRIVDFFRHYMEIAGTNQVVEGRAESAILFQYPLRGWKFYIQPTQLDGFHKSQQVITQAWAITAEVVSDNDMNILSSNTMSQFTDSITQTSLANIGFDPGNPWIDPQAIANSAVDVANFSNNFQNLLGAWSSGNFAATWDFQELNSVNQNFQNVPTTTQQDWVSAFGSDSVNGQPVSGSSSGGGSTTYTGPANPITQSQIVSLINSSFIAAGVPGDIGVATAIDESSLNPDSRQNGGTAPAGSTGIGLFQVNGDGTGAVNQPPSVTYVKKAGLDYTDPVTKNYSASQQIEDAADYFGAAIKTYTPAITASSSDQEKAIFAQSVQRASDSAYITKIETYLPQARKLISQIPTASNNTIVAETKSQLGAAETSTNAGPQVNQYLASVGLNPGYAWCAAFVYWVFQQVLNNDNPLPKTGTVLTMYQYGKQQGWTHSPTEGARIGDLAVFNWTGKITTDISPYHIGIVVGVGSDGTPLIIAGNTDTNNVAYENTTDLVALIRTPIPISLIGS